MTHGVPEAVVNELGQRGGARAFAQVTGEEEVPALHLQHGVVLLVGVGHVEQHAAARKRADRQLHRETAHGKALKKQKGLLISNREITHSKKNNNKKKKTRQNTQLEMCVENGMECIHFF